MKILYIWDADYPWDVRVDKICSSLTNAGYETHIASRNLHRRPSYENVSGIHIHRIKAYKNDSLNYFLSFPAFFNPIWKNFVEHLIKKYGIDILIVRDLPMAIAGIWAGKRHNLRVIFDMAEDYVAMVRDIWEKRKFQGLNLFVRNPYFARAVERYALPRFDHVFVVVEEAIKVAMQAGALSKKVTVIGNTPILAECRSMVNDKQNIPDLLMNNKGSYIAVYTGGVQLGRGLQVVFNAIPEIVKKIPEFVFVIIGTGYAVEQLKKLTRDKCIDKYVLWLGWVPHEEIFYYLHASNVGIIPHYRSAHVDTTIPNKIFDYMACGLPVVASDAPPMQRILLETDAGHCFKSGDSADFVSVLMKVYTSHTNLGENGRLAIKQKYNWTKDEERILNIINIL